MSSMNKKRPAFLAIRATEKDWQNLERIKELMSLVYPSARLNQTYVVSESLRLTAQKLERDAANGLADAPAPDNGRVTA